MLWSLFVFFCLWLWVHYLVLSFYTFCVNVSWVFFCLACFCALYFFVLSKFVWFCLLWSFGWFDIFCEFCLFSRGLPFCRILSRRVLPFYTFFKVKWSLQKTMKHQGWCMVMPQFLSLITEQFFLFSQPHRSQLGFYRRVVFPKTENFHQLPPEIYQQACA